MGDWFTSIGDWFTDSGITAIIGGLLNAIIAALQFLWSVVVFLFQNLIAALQFLFGKIGAAFKWIWDNVIKVGLTKLANLIIKAHLWLEEHLAPVLRILKRIRDYVDRIFRIYIRPILKIIQQVRQVLLILRLLHIKFAQTLDNYLARIQADISRVFLTIRGTLNALIDVVNAISDPSRMARIIAGSVAGRRAAAGLVRIFTGMPIGFFWPNMRSDAPPWEKPIYRAAELKDPARNPLAGTFFDAFTPLPVSDFMAGDPTPTDGVLQGAEPLPYFTDMVLGFKRTDDYLDSGGATGLEAARLIRTGDGNLSPTLSIGLGALAVLAPDLIT